MSDLSKLGPELQARKEYLNRSSERNDDVAKQY